MKLIDMMELEERQELKEIDAFVREDKILSGATAALVIVGFVELAFIVAVVIPQFLG